MEEGMEELPLLLIVTSNPWGKSSGSEWELITSLQTS